MVEAINGVNSANKNTLLYTAGGAATGAVAGGLGGYFTKPYIKNYLATDSFCDAFIKEAKKANPDMARQFDEGVTFIKNLDSIEPLKFRVNALLTKAFAQIDDQKFAQIKASVLQSQEKIAQSGVKGPEFLNEIADKILKANSPDEFKGEISHFINKGLDSINLDTVKGIIKDVEDNAKLLKKGIGSAALLSNFDFVSKKLLVLDGNSVNEMVRKAAKSVQLKSAGIYGAIGAAAVGAGAYIASVFSNNASGQA